MRFKLKVGAFYTDLNGWCWSYSIYDNTWPVGNQITSTGCCYNQANGGALVALHKGLNELARLYRKFPHEQHG